MITDHFKKFSVINFIYFQGTGNEEDKKKTEM